jgi:hypothetical protein
MPPGRLTAREGSAPDGGAARGVKGALQSPAACSNATFSASFKQRMLRPPSIDSLVTDLGA